MEGSVWVNGKEARVEEITGHLIHEVKFGGGLLGHLNKDGTFDVKQAEVARGYWEITLLKVQKKRPFSSKRSACNRIIPAAISDRSQMI